jgi:hypothetical protein
MRRGSGLPGLDELKATQHLVVRIDQDVGAGRRLDFIEDWNARKAADEAARAAAG